MKGKTLHLYKKPKKAGRQMGVNMKKEAKIRYLNHSGFTIETDKYFMIFDYFVESDEEFTGELEDTKYDTASASGKQVLVFASHSHFDHYNVRILEWIKNHPSIQYILSDDITLDKDGINKDGTDKEGIDKDKLNQSILKVHSCKEYELLGINIKTLRSTDEGVAFLIKADGFTIYHGGDLNWWHWNGETSKYNQAMEKNYCREIDKLENLDIDIAFLPLDPRLEDKYSLGFKYFIDKTNTHMIFSMHCHNQFHIIDTLKSEDDMKENSHKIVSIDHRDEQFTYQK